ncbi:hypothetical protein CTAYLR_001684 [Chrysophaeum taylorii]|uniref:CRAL-TRIO domain-containing protein n=1 Tax=Chrysophaeum taylorii TaxID=2483200 RepID=A0AAD7U7F0_9STRA|nr:hypothetical protein CTAYLR_001684 [Chrysophaeum taylorii]
MDDVSRLAAELGTEDTKRVARFLRAEKGDVRKAETRLRRHLEWRAKTLPIPFETVREELEKLKVVVLPERDGEGRVVVVIRARLLGAHTYGDIGECERAIICFAEGLERTLDSDEKITVIFSRLPPNHKPDLRWVKMVGGLLQEHYPERLHLAVVAPVPAVMLGLWHVVKMLFDPVTRSKIKIAKHSSCFLDLVPPDRLPLELGGKADYVLSKSDLFVVG